METRQKKIFVFRTRSSEHGTVSFRSVVYKTPAAIEKQERIPDALLMSKGRVEGRFLENGRRTSIL